MPPEKTAQRKQVLDLYNEGETVLTLREIAIEVGVNRATVSRWLKDAEMPIYGGRLPDPRRWATGTCLSCEREFDYMPSQTPGKYCSEVCRISHARESAKANNSVCPCGAEIKPTGKTRHTYRKYCTPECRSRYAAKRQKDPSKWVIFNCQTCGEEVTRRKTYGGGANKFCSNLCAAKHTKRVRHYVVRETDMVLDSGWEVLFAGVLGFLKIPVERTDREQGVEWTEGNWYCPDFHLPSLGLWIEVKGQEDPEDVVKWAAFRKHVGPLAVLDKDGLEAIRSLDRAGVETYLKDSAESD